jgi:hypothetical protein
MLLGKTYCGKDMKMKMVKCNVCSIVEGREKLQVPKLVSLVKQYGLKKCIIARPSFVVG